MASASPKEKFDAAVKVIHSLPKDGPFQPSKEMMLTFYGFYKQATEGPCKSPKPSFWDIVKKAKWEAWSKLGDMEPETAMLKYVDELKLTMKDCSQQWNEMSKNGDPRIVEAMPQTSVVGDFMGTLGTFYELVDDESPIEAARRTQPHLVPSLDDGYSTESSPDKGESEEVEVNDSGDGPRSETADHTYSRKSGSDPGPVYSSDSEEEFCDTSMDLEVPISQQNGSVPSLQTSVIKSSKTNHVRFADQNGHPSSTERRAHVNGKESLRVSQGFPFISTGTPESQDDSLLVQTGSPVEARLGHLDHDLDLTAGNDLDIGADVAMAGTASCLGIDVVDVNGQELEGGDEHEPPDGGQGGDKDRGQGKPSQQGQTPRRSGSRGGLGSSSSGAGRRQLLAGGGAGGEEGGNQQPSGGGAPVDQHIQQILVRLQQDMTSVLDRLNRLEAQNRQSTRKGSPVRGPFAAWWPFASRAGSAAFFFLVWPVIVHLVLSYLFRRRRRR